MKKAWLTASLCIVSALLFTACSGSSPSSDKNNSSDPGTTVGEPSVHTVSSSSVVDISDSTSGATFTFPEGGQGTLSVAKIESGLEKPDDGAELMQVTYTGADSLYISFPAEQDEEVVLYSYLTLDNAAIDDMAGAEGWWGIPPVSEDDGTSTFNISAHVLGGTGASKAAISNPDASVFAVNKVKKGSPAGLQMLAVRASVQEVVTYWLDNLPSSLASSARTQIAGDLAYKITWSSGGNAYIHGNNYIFSNAVFELKRDASLSTIAHEVGHYMNHVLCGYDRYVQIFSRMPTNFIGMTMQHGIPDYHPGRKYLLEEYAYYSDYMINGIVAGSLDIENPVMFTVLGSSGPDAVDFPSHEGYGSIMLGALTRSSDKVVSYNKSRGKVDAPVVKAPLADVLGILAKGPRDTNELREVIQDYLSGLGHEHSYKLPAMMEPLGWSYNGSGNIIDADNEPVSGAWVYSVSQDGSRDYYATKSTTSDKDGKFNITAIYPGSNLLRVFYNAGRDSTDFPFTVEWTKPTNEPLKIGKLKIDREESVIPLDYSRQYVLTPGIRAQNPLDISFSGQLTGSGGLLAYTQDTGSYLDIQGIMPLNDDVRISVDLEYTLFKGLNFKVDPGDVEGATKCTMSLASPRYVYYERFDSGDNVKRTAAVTPSINIQVPAADAKTDSYGLDLRIEWDFEQHYYDKDGASIRTETGTTGAYFLHVWLSAY